MAIKKLTERYVDIKETKLSPTSMIRMFNILKDENDEYWMNIFKNFVIDPTILNDPANISTIGVVEPWWEMLGYSYYNDIETWWVVCTINDILNPFEEIVVGGTIDMLPKGYLSHIRGDMEVIFNL